MDLRLGKQSGFTLLEVICVLVIIGILAAVAVVRIHDIIDDSNLEADTESLKNHIRYVQIWSISHTDRNFGVQCENNTCEAFYITASSDSAASLDIGSKTRITFPGSQTGSTVLSDSQVNNFNLAFDFAGRPFSGTGNNLNLVTTTLNIILSGSSGSLTISVTPDTGFIP